MTDSLLIAIAAFGFIGLFAFGFAWYLPLFSPDAPSDLPASDTFRHVSLWGLDRRRGAAELGQAPCFLALHPRAERPTFSADDRNA
jgi:hypothetical protein